MDSGEAKVGCFLAFVFACVCLFVPSCKMVGGINFDYSEGERVGVVYKFSKKGIVFKTWEGELSLGLMEQTDEGALVPKIFYFSCSSDEVAQQLIAAERSRQKVALHYKEYLMRGYRYGDSGYDIQKVLTLEEPEKK